MSAPNKSDQYDAFLSYASDDGEWCEELALKLQNQGVRVWFDRWEIKYGDHMSANLDSGLKKSRKMIAVWSKNYFRDDKVWTLAEGYSRQFPDPLSKQRPLIPILIEECDISPLFVNIRSIDFSKKKTDYYEMRFRELIEALDLPKPDDSAREIIDIQARRGKDVEFEAPQKRDEKFKDKVAELYRLLGFEAKRKTEQYGIDIDLFIKKKEGGLLHQAIVMCEEKRIAEDECGRILDKRKSSRKILPKQYRWIAVSAQGFEAKSCLSFKKAGIEYVHYSELLNELAPMESYVDRLVLDLKKWREERWGGEDWFIHPHLLADITGEELSALNCIARWLGDPKVKQLVILGDLGTGKTTLAGYAAYELAENFLKDPLRHPAPVLIPLGEIRKGVDLESIIVSHFSSRGLRNINFDGFEHLVRIGKVIIFFDAFDEMADRVKWETTEKNFQELSRIAKAGGKFILTCRTHYFKDKAEQRKALGFPSSLTESDTILYAKLREDKGEAVYLKEFDDGQIKEYLGKTRGKNAEEDWKKIEAIYNLKELANRPLLLDMIVKSLPGFKPGDAVNAASLYRVYTNLWLDRDYKKGHLFLNKELKENLMIELAWRMHSEEKKAVDYRELISFLEKASQGKPGMFGDEEIEAVAGELQRASFLKHADKAGDFTFMHKSFMEYFLAVKLYKALIGSEKKLIEEALNTRRFDQKIIFFLTLLDGKDQIREPLQKILTDWYINNVSENALQILYWSSRIRLGMEEEIDNIEKLRNALAECIPARAQLTDAGLHGIVLEGAELNGANMSGVHLTGANLNNVLLRNVDLSEANLTRASVKNLFAFEVDFREAELSGVSFIDAKINGCDFNDAKWSYGAFISAELQNCKGLEEIRGIDLNNLLPVVQLGAASSVNAVAYSSNGRLIAAASRDSLIRLYTADDGRLIRTLEGHQYNVNSVAFSSDDKRIASGSWDNTVRLWEASTGNLIRTLEGHQSYVNSVAFSSDDNYIASGSFDKTVKLWEASTGNLIRTLEGHKFYVNSVAFSSDDKQIASGSLDNTVRLWEASTGNLIRTLEGHLGWVNSVAFSSDNNYIASGSSDNTVRLWEASTGNLIRTLKGHQDSVTSVAFSSNDNYIASVSWGGTVRLWEASTGNLIPTLKGHLDRVNEVKFSPNGKYLIAAGAAGRLQFWDYEKGDVIIYLYGFGRVGWLALLPDGRFDGNAEGIRHLRYSEIGRSETYSAEELKEFYDPTAVKTALEAYVK